MTDRELYERRRRLADFLDKKLEKPPRAGARIRLEREIRAQREAA